MTPGVLGQVVTAGEALGAQRAGEALLARVRPVVAGQLVRARELLVATWPVAGKRAFTCGSSEVPPKHSPARAPSRGRGSQNGGAESRCSSGGTAEGAEPLGRGGTPGSSRLATPLPVGQRVPAGGGATSSTNPSHRPGWASPILPWPVVSLPCLHSSPLHRGALGLVRVTTAWSVPAQRQGSPRGSPALEASSGPL